MDRFFASINGKWLPWKFTDGHTRSGSTAPTKLPLNLHPPPREVSSLIHNDNSVSFRIVKRYKSGKCPSHIYLAALTFHDKIFWDNAYMY